jgi:hypothetical protein
MAKVIVIAVDGQMNIIDANSKTLYDHLSLSTTVEYLSTSILRNGLIHEKELPILYVTMNRYRENNHLPVNPFAEALFQKYNNHSTIVGNIIIAKYAGGEVIDLREEQINFVKSIVDAVHNDYV